MTWSTEEEEAVKVGMEAEGYYLLTVVEKERSEGGEVIDGRWLAGPLQGRRKVMCFEVREMAKCLGPLPEVVVGKVKGKTLRKLVACK
jgi:hypothetical protein